MGKFRAFAFIERKMEAKPLNSAVRAPTLELFMAVMNAFCFVGVVKRVGSSNNVFGGAGDPSVHARALVRPPSQDVHHL